MAECLKTARLNVFRFECEPTEMNTIRHVYIGFRTNEDHPAPVVTAVVEPGVVQLEIDPYLDWIETSSQFRRQGLATELLRLLEERHPGIIYDGATDEGDAFLDAYENLAVPESDG